jgi:hypothetical protein
MTTAEDARRARDRVAAEERVVSLSEAAEILRMKRPNVAKFLARRGIEPAFPKAQGYFWWFADVDRARQERESDEAKMAADRQRRASAVNGPPARSEPPPAEVAKLGPVERAVLSELLRRPIPYPKDSRRFALRRLRQRGLVVQVPAEKTWQLSPRGRELASWV